MTALAQGKQIRRLSAGDDDYAGQKGNTIIYSGGIVLLDAAGLARPGQTATGMIAVGLAQPNRGIDRYDATAAGPLGLLADGVQTVRWDEGTFPMANSGGADAVLSTTQPGTPLWVVDDQTVALTNGGGTRSPAGRFHHLDGVGVWVTMGKNIAGQIAGSVLETVIAEDVASTGASTPIATMVTPATGLYRVTIVVSAHTNSDTVTATVAFTDAVEGFATTLTPISAVVLTHDSNTGTTSASVLVRASAATSIIATLSVTAQVTTKASAIIERLN